MQYDENAEKYGYEGEMTPLKCDELKAYKWDVTIPVYGTIADAEVYLKSEADKVIAELEARIKEGDKEFDFADHQNECLLKELRHSNHKRCLAMAWWCSAELGMLVSTWESKIKHYKRWQQRWLELAEKVKEGK